MGQCGCGTPDTDSDGDGTADCIDVCPDDPNFQTGDPCLCDSDNDGSTDCNDLCPGDPSVTKPNGNTCSCDNDQDAVGDCADSDPWDEFVCSDTDGDTCDDCTSGTYDPNNDGPDPDGDGTCDVVDRCPGDDNKTAPGACGCGNLEPVGGMCGDADGDGWSDSDEAACGTDPTDGSAVPADGDGDGTCDVVDGCPSDVNKTDPALCGCGVAEGCADLCPSDPDKRQPGACGCGWPDEDTDGDGTLDCYDGCATDPARTDPVCHCTLDDDGDGQPNCSDPCPYDSVNDTRGSCDSDGDGTPDTADKCPDDPQKDVPGTCGCGESDADNDASGESDCLEAPGFYPSGGAGSILFNGRIHLIGGANAHGSSLYPIPQKYFSRKHMAINPSTGIWTALAPVPDGYTWSTKPHEYEGKLYLVGGRHPTNTGGGGVLFRRYDPDTDTWSPMPDMPVSHDYGFVSALIGDYLYVIGGDDTSWLSENSHRFSFLTNTWEAIAPITPLHTEAGTVGAGVGTRIYVLNSDLSGDPNRMRIYDTLTNSWSEGAVLVDGRFEAATAIADGQYVYFFGGSPRHRPRPPPATVSDAINIYDTVNDAWVPSLTTLSIPRMWATGVIYDGQVHLMGGLDGDGLALPYHEIVELPLVSN